MSETTASPAAIATAPGILRCRRWLGRERKGWVVVSLLVAAVVAIPLAIIAGGLLEPASENWSHLLDTVMGAYVGNTVGLACSVGFLSLVFALPSAWFVSTCDFPGRKFFEWTLVLPLAIPTYVAAYAYTPLYEQLTPLVIFLRSRFGNALMLASESVATFVLLSFVLASVLFPYVYLAARAAFTRQAATSTFEASRMLGATASKTFFRVALPLARPAVVGGLALIVMEVANDYGAVKHFGVRTLTSGIFRSWGAMGDLGTAVRLSASLMLVVFVVLAIERLQRGKARYHDRISTARPFRRRRLSGLGRWSATVVCFLPLAAGFIYPVYRLALWAIASTDAETWGTLAAPLWNSFAVSAFVALLVATGAVFLSYASRLTRSPLVRSAHRVSMLGYSIPGAVIAVAVLSTTGRVDSLFTQQVIGGTVGGLVVAYFARFLAVGLGTVTSGMERVCGRIDEASTMLGSPPATTLFRVVLPVLRPSIVAAVALVFVDLLKELPLTLILRPFNFETLATTAFTHASEERIYDAALPSLIIVAIGASASLVLNRLLRQSSP